MPLGTETGRFAARNPNLQNMPRKGSDPIGIRNMLVAPEGYQVMELDYSQIELRVGAFYCRDAVSYTHLDVYKRQTQYGVNYNPEWPIRVNVEHILGDAENLSRIPPEIREA